MISINYLFEFDALTNALDPETFKAAGTAAKRTASKFADAISQPGETIHRLTHDPESGASYGGTLFRTKKAIGLDNAENRFQLARSVHASTNPDIKQQWGSFLKKKND